MYMSDDIAVVSPNMQRDFDLPDQLVPRLVQRWGALIHERDKARYFVSIEKMIQGDTDEHNLEYQVQNRKGNMSGCSAAAACRGMKTNPPECLSVWWWI